MLPSHWGGGGCQRGRETASGPGNRRAARETDEHGRRTLDFRRRHAMQALLTHRRFTGRADAPSPAVFFSRRAGAGRRAPAPLPLPLALLLLAAPWPMLWWWWWWWWCVWGGGGVGDGRRCRGRFGFLPSSLFLAITPQADSNRPGKTKVIPIGQLTSSSRPPRRTHFCIGRPRSRDRALIGPAAGARAASELPSRWGGTGGGRVSGERGRRGGGGGGEGVRLDSRIQG